MQNQSRVSCAGFLVIAASRILRKDDSIMTFEQIQYLEKWFDQHVRGFDGEDPDVSENIRLKVTHTVKVREACRRIAKSLRLGEGDRLLAEACGLMHDVGRFEQYARFKTFVDAKSVDHAELGASLLEKESVLDSLRPGERHVIIRAVRYHNRLSLFLNDSPRVLFFTKLLRDADKIDIYRVVTDYYRTAHVRRNEAIQLDLPDTPEISGQVIADIHAKRLVKKAHLRTLNDFKLLQMAWVYGFNFAETCRIVRGRGYLEKIRQTLPDTDEVERLYQTLLSDLKARCGRLETGRTGDGSGTRGTGDTIRA
ncbi:MAG TPA: HD domain-containing protein [bacterium]|nr:HD domain-containing protein [bacterium]